MNNFLWLLEFFGWHADLKLTKIKKGVVGLAEDFGPRVLVSLKRHIPKIDWTKEQLLSISF